MVWGLLGVMTLLIGPILWIIHKATPYYRYTTVHTIYTYSLREG